MRADAGQSRHAASPQAKPLPWTVLGSLALTGLLSGTSAAAHKVERASSISEVRVQFARDPIRIPHHAGHLEVSFRPAFGSMRAELTFHGQSAQPAHFHVPLSNGSLLNVDFRGRHGAMRSTQPLAKLVDGTLLDITEREGVHRLVLRDAAGVER